jgi:uncharacterized protein YdeI (BOF family)
VIDSKDRCIDEKGLISNFGCPKIVQINFKKPNVKDNRLIWKNSLADKSKFRLKLTLVDEASQEVYHTEDVSGKSEFTVPDEYIVGRNGYKTTVRLDVISSEQYTTTTGETRLFGQKFWCKTQ